MTPSPILDSILQRIGQPGLARTLASDLSGTELNTLLLEVFQHRVKALTPGKLLSSYRKNRFVKPADLPVMPLRKMEIDLLGLFAKEGFEAIELSPVSVLGSCAAVGTASQHKILTALRGTEVLADATNAIALHVADLKSGRGWKSPSADGIHFCTIQRHLRTQAIGNPGFTPHFRIGCLVSAGYDTGNYSFECETVSNHIGTLKRLYEAYHQVTRLAFRILCRPGYPDPQALAAAIRKHVLLQYPGTAIDIIGEPPTGNAYYKGIQYKVDIEYNGRSWEIGDGGFVDWTQQLLQNRKERMFTTGIGFEFMYRLLNDLL
jgi:hypothetical protein